MTTMTYLEAGKAALEAARAAPWPDASGALTDVQDVGAPAPSGAERGAVS